MSYLLIKTTLCLPLFYKNSEAIHAFYLEGVFPADVVIHGQHGDVKAGQQDTSQNAVFFLICSEEIQSHERNMATY